MDNQTADEKYPLCNDCDNEYIGQTKRQFGTFRSPLMKALDRSVETLGP